MTLQLKTKTELFDLHCSVGLTDWDMDKELKLATTTDQFFHGVNEGCHSRPKCALGYLGHFMFHCLSLMTDDKLNEQYVIQRPSARASRRKDDFIWYDKTSDTFVKPNLWLLVNPDIACPIQCEPSTEVLQTPHEPTDEIQRPLLKPAENQHPPSRQRRMFAPHHVSVKEALLHPVSTTTTTKRLRNKEDVSCRPAKNRRKGRTTKARESKNLKPGCWPRPPVNYCILIALALKSSHTGSLKVQQIYNFTREHFPFFQTAPDGWKNTIRHNLCFSNSFCKTCNQLCRDGKRKSCFWHLTMDGHRRLKDEIRALAGDSLKQLERSMSRPDIIWSLLAL